MNCVLLILGVLAGCARQDAPAEPRVKPPATTPTEDSGPAVSGDTSSPVDTGPPEDTGPPPPLAWVTADAGSPMSCGLLNDGTIRCWGIPECVSVAPGPLQKFEQISVGNSEACGIRSDGTVGCWCCSDVGGDGGNPRTCGDAPSGAFDRVEVGSFLACAQDSDGMLTCWGLNSMTRPAPSEPVTDFAIENSYGCAILLDGSITCFGGPSTWGSGRPPEGVDFVDVAPSRYSACGLDTAGALHCWGNENALGLFPPAPAGTFVSIDSFQISACALDAAGTPTCFGPDTAKMAEWAAAMPATPFQQIGLGEFDACGVTVDGQAHCWTGDPAEEPWLRVPEL